MLSEKISAVKNSVVAVGVLNPPTGVNIIGSAFSVRDSNTLLSAAHLFKPLSDDDVRRLAVMTVSKEESKLTRYQWLPVEVEAREDANDMALLKLKGEHDTLLEPLSLGDTKSVAEGQEVYFVGYPYAAVLMNEGFGVTLISNRGMISSVKHKSAPPNPLDWFIVDAISNPGNSGCPLISVDSNKVIGVMSISFSKRSRVPKYADLDIRETMHIAGAKPINLADSLL